MTKFRINKLTDRSNYRCFTAIVVSMAFCFSMFRPQLSYGQYYPAPKQVAQEQLKGLRARLNQSATDQEKLQTLLSLGNLYLGKPLKQQADLQRSIHYISQAIELAQKLQNREAHNDALLLSAFCQLELREFRSAEDILPQLNENNRLKLLLALSYFYWSADRPETDYRQRSLEFAGRALKLAQKLHNGPGELMALVNTAVVHGFQDKPVAEKELLDILGRYKAASNPFMHFPFFYLAYYYSGADQTDKASDYLLRALQSIRDTRDSTNAGDVFLLQSIICYRNDHFLDGVDYGNRAIAAYRKYPGIKKLSDPFLTLTISRNYQKLGQHEKALAYMQNMMRTYPPKNLSDSLTYLSMIAHGFRELKKYDKSEQYFKQFAKLSGRSKDSQYTIDHNFGQLYVESHQYQKARPYLYRLLPNEKKLPMADRRHIRYLLYLTDSATGHYKEALRHMSFLNDQAESNRRRETDQALKRWEVAYETQKREELLKLKNQNIELLTQRSLAQQEKIKRADLVRNLIAGGFMLVLVILGLIIYQFRQKQRTNRLVLAKSNQIHQKNVLLEKLLVEKEWLLKEVHHRVKNNLHTIFCLLESQAVFLQDDALAAVETSRNRIYAMSLLHQKLYQSDNIKVVDMALYFNEFLVYLRRSFDLEERNIRIELDIDALRFDISIAIPLGLILNEAVTNAIKYAFTGRNSGIIDISLKQYGQRVELKIGDNGIGLTKATPVIQNSLGIELMRGLSLDIGAEINFEVTVGTKISVTFIVDENSSITDIDRKLA
jgi:two-component sensor histidine kinase